MLTVVLDVNILASAAVSEAGRPRIVVGAGLLDLIEYRGVRIVTAEFFVGVLERDA